MPTDEKRPTDDTEKGFGTGLRAQLARRRDAEPVNMSTAVEETAEAFEAAKALAEASANGVTSDAGVEAMRVELAASLAREEDLRATLSEQLDSREREVLVGHELAERAIELDNRAGRLAADEADLEERERRVAEQHQRVQAEQERLSELQARVAGEEALSAERDVHIKAKLQELKDADKERGRATSELSTMKVMFPAMPSWLQYRWTRSASAALGVTETCLTPAIAKTTVVWPQPVSSVAMPGASRPYRKRSVSG